MDQMHATKQSRAPNSGIVHCVRLWVATLIVVTGNIVAEPSFPAIDAEPLGHVTSGAVVLHEDWQMRESLLAGDDGGAISRAGFTTAGWYDTAVPATALGVLVRHGIYPDPIIGTNNMFIPDASDDHNRRYQLGRFSHLPDQSNPWAKPYWFRKEFVLPESYAGKTVWLHLDGINYRADVWLNGRPVAVAGHVAGMFQRFLFDVSSFTRKGETNALAIRIHPLDFPGDPFHEQIGGVAGGFGYNGGDGEILRNVTEYCAIGWDWVPAARDRNMGLWQHVWLEAAGPVVVRDPAAFIEMNPPNAKAAAVTVRCQIENPQLVEQAVELTVRLAPDGFDGDTVEVRTNVVARAHTTTEVILKPARHPALVLRNPRLWWPVNYGEQPLYRLVTEVRVLGQVSSQAESRFGVRVVGSLVLPSGGRAFTVNGRVIRMTGGAWIPDFLMSWSAQRYRDEVRLMAEGNHTIVRVNGCGIVPPDVFFDECDRRGLLVWQDLSRTSFSGSAENRKDGKTGGDPLPCDTGLYLENMKDCILRLRGHPSLLVWCGSNENVPQADAGEALQNEILPALDGTRPWLPMSDAEVPPPWRKAEMAVWSGGPWHMVRLPEYFRMYAMEPRFPCKDEIGLGSPPPINSIARAIPDYDLPGTEAFPLNVTLGYHDATDRITRALDKIMHEDMGEPSCLTEYLAMGDLYNDVSYRAIFEAANKARPRNAGTHLWKVNAAWPSMVWQVFDWYLRPNAGYYSMRSACRPLHIQYSADDQTVQVVSTLPEPRLVRIRISLADAAGRLEKVVEHSLTASADANTPVGPLPEEVKDGGLHFLALDLSDDTGRQLDRSVTWVRADCRWPELLSLPPARIEAKVLKRNIEADESVYTISVCNTSTVPAVHVWLEVIRGVQGEEVLPAFWSDNALNLLPGECRSLTARFRTGLLGGKPPHLMVEGWNVLPCEQAVSNGQEMPLTMHVTACEIGVEGTAVRVQFAATQAGPDGPRLTTWPVKVRLDGQVVRYARMGLRKGVTGRAILKFPGLGVGEHRIAVGDGPEKVITITQ